MYKPRFINGWGTILRKKKVIYFAASLVGVLAINGAFVTQTYAAKDAPLTTNKAKPAVTQTAKPIAKSSAKSLTKKPQPAPIYEITAIELAYSRVYQGLPAIDELMALQVPLAIQNGGYIAWHDGLEKQTVTLSNVPQLAVKKFYASAIQTISQALVGAFNQRGIGGVSIMLAAKQVDRQGKDIRPSDDKRLKLIVKTLTITQIRTQAIGSRINATEAMDNPLHRRIAKQSPVKPTTGGGLLQTKSLDQYIRYLNRYPGRRVDVAVIAGKEPDTLALKYLVQESKPWTAYFQASNTGTAQTSEWRETFGFTNYQLTGRDDIFSVSYSTAGFQASHAFSISYDAPVFNVPRLRWNTNVAYSEYLASDVGGTGLNFRGKSFSVAAELVWNFYQKDDLFIDGFVGGSFYEITVRDDIAATKGRAQFFLPRAGVRLEQATDSSSLSGSAYLTGNFDDWVGTTAVDASQLGRTAVDSSWTILRWNVAKRFYLDPLLNPKGWKERTIPLVHEFVFAVQGQEVFNDDRVISQEQQTAGGLYTVRGYRESVAVGDNVVVVNMEYRFHLPRIFAVRAKPSQIFGKPFRWAAQTTGGQPDWDLILKTFMDYAQTQNNNPQAGDNNQSLLGVGVGVELQIKQNLNVRVEWAQALKAVSDVKQHSSRIHIITTLLF